MQDCIFCKIINKEIPANVVYEDEDVLAFRDIHPMAPVHVLIIPKKHIKSLMEITTEDEKLIGKLHTVIKEVAKQENIETTGFRVINNCGDDGMQVVKHLHFHLLGGKNLGAKIIH